MAEAPQILQVQRWEDGDPLFADGYIWSAELRDDDEAGHGTLHVGALSKRRVEWRGLHLPKVFKVGAEFEELPLTPIMVFQVTGGGFGPRCFEIRFIAERRVRVMLPHYATSEQSVISQTTLREMPIVHLQDLAVRAACIAFAMPEGADYPTALNRWGAGMAEPAQLGRAPRRQMDDDHYRLVAGLYNEAARLPGTSVLRHISETLNTSESSAGRWIAEARERGLLPPTVKGKRRGSDQ